MAQPIPLKLPPRDPKQELLAKLENAPAEHAAALLDGYELLQQLHEHGVFTLVRGALGATDKLVEAVSTAVGETFGDAKLVPAKPPSLFSLLIGFTGPDHRRGLALVERLFKKLGSHLRSTGNSS